MIKFSKVSSLALGLALVAGLGLSNLASANTASGAAYSQVQTVAEGGADRLQELRERVAEGGSDRLIERRVAEGGADRLQELRERVAEGGSDRLIERRVAEGGADRLQELRERVAQNAVQKGVIVAENRPEFGSKYQRY